MHLTGTFNSNTYWVHLCFGTERECFWLKCTDLFVYLHLPFWRERLRQLPSPFTTLLLRLHGETRQNLVCREGFGLRVVKGERTRGRFPSTGPLQMLINCSLWISLHNPWAAWPAPWEAIDSCLNWLKLTTNKHPKDKCNWENVRSDNIIEKNGFDYTSKSCSRIPSRKRYWISEGPGW